MRSRQIISLFLGLASLALLINASRTGYTSPATTPSPHHTTADTLIVEPTDGMSPILTGIAAASTSIDVVMYEFEDPSIAQALAQARSRGVVVRVLLNGGYYGKKENTQNDKAYQYLIAHDITVHWSPSNFALTHQKTLVVDNARAYILTFNFTPQYYASSRDFGIIDTDSTDVADIESIFDADWNNKIQSPSNQTVLVWSPGSEQTLINLIQGATKTLDIYNQEMADKKIITALMDAENRGVAVRIVMTDSTQWHAAWKDLVKSGAKVHTYSAKAPTYIHAKMIVSDAATMFIGSENFSQTSFQKNRELGIITTDTHAITTVQHVFEQDWGDTDVFTN
jgi:cardiolipin synthase